MQQYNTKRLRSTAAGLIVLVALSTLFSFTSTHRYSFFTPHAVKAVVAAHTAAAVTIPVAVPSFFDEKKSLYDSIALNQYGLSRDVYEMALKGMEKLVHLDKVQRNILSIADFSKPSNEKRLFVIDLDLGELVFHTWVAHGRNSGEAFARSFSNKPSSRKSSLGFYITGTPYQGSNGYSLKLLGVETGVNHKAADRGIVIHGADYVGENAIEQKGYLGRSQGCPAVTPAVNRPLINTIKEGSCLFIYHPTPSYIYRSSLLR